MHTCTYTYDAFYNLPPGGRKELKTKQMFLLSEATKYVFPHRIEKRQKRVHFISVLFNDFSFVSRLLHNFTGETLKTTKTEEIGLLLEVTKYTLKKNKSKRRNEVYLMNPAKLLQLL